MYAPKLNDNESLRMTEAEYLAFAAKQQDAKYEYVDGQVLAMNGGTIRHGVIAGRTITHINNQIGDRDCVATSSDVRVYIAHKQTYRYPDVTVFCGEPTYHEDNAHTLTNPVLLVEVLSPSSTAIDSRQKLDEYTRIKSLQAYLLISQDEPHVALYRRQSADEWVYTVAFGLDATVDVPLAGETLTLSLAAIYRHVQWDEDTPDESDAQP